MTAKEVRLVSGAGEQLGIVPIEEALAKAEELGVDLVEIAPQAEPPVCKLIDYGKFLYQREKKAKEALKHQKIVEIKEMKLKPSIADHDFSYRAKQMQEFLQGGDKVKITIRFRGRERDHTEKGFVLADKVIEAMKEWGTPEKPPKLEGRQIVFVLNPKAKK
ncbi:translation initiation factor IF-3 [Thermospira aquatica]|uniref:translation initiation factor IF-3 n=1 Tax=Thermospira aquatica TaxID=2828656 RepID=UPI0038CD9C5B